MRIPKQLFLAIDALIRKSQPSNPTSLISAPFVAESTSHSIILTKGIDINAAHASLVAALPTT